jgi:hypothetical protein
MKKIFSSLMTLFIFLLFMMTPYGSSSFCADTEPGGGAIREILEAHNRYRSALNIPPLKWSDRLAKDAMTWAGKLASENAFYHSRGTGQGENLWKGTSGYFTFTQMVDTWGNEKKYFRYGAFPQVSTSGNWSDVGHYTQIIWRETTEVGCAKASKGGYDFFVCRYSPPGNFMRQQVY